MSMTIHATSPNRNYEVHAFIYKQAGLTSEASRQFPVNSWSFDNIFDATKCIINIMNNTMSGIDEIRIIQEKENPTA